MTEHNDPLLAYCNALIESIHTVKPSQAMSIECIKVALMYNKIDSLTRWIAQKKLTFSYEAGQLIEQYAKQKPKISIQMFELALFVYTDLKSPFEMAVCMARLGKILNWFRIITFFLKQYHFLIFYNYPYNLKFKL